MERTTDDSTMTLDLYDGDQLAFRMDISCPKDYEQAKLFYFTIRDAIRALQGKGN